MRYARRVLLLLAVAAAALGFLAACGGDGGTRTVEFRGDVMGTTWSVKIARVGEHTDLAALAAGIQSVLDDVDAHMSTWKRDSELSRFNADRTTDWFPLSGDTRIVLREALRVSAATDGAFDVTVGPLVDAWGFGPQPAAPPSEEALRRAQVRVGWRRLELRRAPPALRKTRADVEVDLSGIAKGHAIDRVVAYLEARERADFVVELGGEVAARGTRAPGAAWTAGIEHPRTAGHPVCRVVRLENIALATSGDYRRFHLQDGRRVAHVLDPRTGRPVRHGLASVSVLADTAMQADAWATALLVLGPEEGLSLAQREDLAVLMLGWEGEQLVERSTLRFRQCLVRDAATQPREAGGLLRGGITLLAGFLLMGLAALALALRRFPRRCPAGCAGACPPIRRSPP